MLRVRDKRLLVAPAVAFALAISIGGRFPYLLFYGWAAFVLTSWLWARANIRGLACHFSVDRTRLTAGEGVSVRFKLYNEGYLPVPRVEVRDPLASSVGGAPPVRTASLGPGGSAVWTYSPASLRRGNYPLGPVELTSGDVFGIFSTRALAYSTARLLVYPRVVPIRHVELPPLQPYGNLKTGRRVDLDPWSLAGVREYRYGDNQRRGHWKTTARTGRLHVKEYEATGTSDLNIFCDLCGAAYSPAGSRGAVDAEDTAVEAAVSIAFYGLRRGYGVSFLAYSSRRAAMTLGRGKKGFTNLLETAASLRADGAIPAAELLRVEGARLPPRSAVVAVTPRLDRPLAGALVSLKKRGHPVSLVHVNLESFGAPPDPPGPGPAASLGDAGVAVYTLPRGADLSRALGGEAAGSAGHRNA